jgi:hypothetical protein
MRTLLAYSGAAARRSRRGAPAVETPSDPPFSSTGVWGDDYDYSESIWTLTNRAGTTIGVGANVPAQFMGTVTISKHMQSFYHAGQDRVWFGVGDANSYAGSGNIDGYRADFQGSNQPAIYSFDPDSPTTIRQEIGSVPYDDAVYDEVVWCPADEGFMTLDTDNDRAYVCPLDSHGGGWVVDGPTPTYASATSFTVTGDQTATFTARRRVLVLLNHSTGGANTPKRGRVSSSSYNGSVTTVNLAWWTHDSDITMSLTNPPTAIKLEDATWQARGGWMIGDGYGYFRETGAKWKKALLQINPTTRATAAVFFDVTGHNVAACGTDMNFKNCIFAPASTTMSGDPEIHSFQRISNLDGQPNAWVFNLDTLVISKHALTGVGSVDGESFTQPWPCFDGERYAYTCSYWEHKLTKWDVLTRTVVWSKEVTYQSEWLFGSCEQNGTIPSNIYGDPVVAEDGVTEQAVVSTDLIWLHWNDEIKRIELIRTGERKSDVWFIDPAQDTLNDSTGGVELIANVDNNSLELNTWDQVHIPKLGTTPPRTIMYGGLSFDTNRNSHPDKMRIFVGSGKRQWEELSVASHPRITVTNGSSGNTTNSDLTDARSPTDETRVIFRSWGGFHVSREGRAYYLGGGHGDYHGTEVDNCDLSAISGTSMPWRQNIGAPFNDSAQTFRRPHVPEWLDDTGFDGLNNTGYGGSGSNWMWWDVSENTWQHDACHMFTSLDSHPTLGLLMGPPGNVPNNLILPANVRDHENGYKSWSPTTGKWTAHTSSFSTGLSVLLTYNNSMFCGYNRDHDYMLWYYNNGFADSRFHQYTPGGSQQMASVSVATILPNSWHGCAFWLTGHQFLIVADGYELAAPKWWLYTHSLTSPTLEDVTPATYTTLQNAALQNGQLCFDYDHDRVWYLYGQDTNAPRLFWSPLSDLSNMQEASMTDTSGFRPTSNSTSEEGKKSLSYWNGYLWTVTRGDPWAGATWSSANETRFWRVPVYA